MNRYSNIIKHLLTVIAVLLNVFIQDAVAVTAPARTDSAATINSNIDESAWAKTAIIDHENQIPVLNCQS